MAGGIFTDRPFVINPKCILFSVLVMALYLADPRALKKYQPLVLVALFFVSYVGMAWYDYFYDCLEMERGSKSLTAMAKPPLSEKKKRREVSERKHREASEKKKRGEVSEPKHGEVSEPKRREVSEEKRMLMIYILHLAMIVPVLAYVAWKGNTMKELLGALAAFTAIYHAGKLFSRRSEEER